MQLGIGLALTAARARSRRWSPAALFAGGQPGHWPGGYDPANGRVWRDLDGNPALNPDQTLAIVQRLAGSADALQATPASRALLARWPVGGRRNMVLWTEDFANAAWAKVGMAAGPELIEATVTNNGHRLDQQVYFGLGLQKVLVEAKADILKWLRIRINGESGSTGAAVGGGGNFAFFDLENGVAGSGVASKSITPVGDGWYRCSIDITVTTAGTLSVQFYPKLSDTGNQFDNWMPATQSGIRLRSAANATPYQRVTTANDVTEAGVANVWHASRSGGQSLPITLPAGTYGRAVLDALGNVTIDTVTDPTQTLFVDRQADVILRLGAYSPAEDDAIHEYWAA